MANPSAPVDSSRRTARSRYLASPLLLALILALSLSIPHGILIYAFYAIAVITALPTWDRHFVRQMSLAAAVFVLLDAALLQQTASGSWDRLFNSAVGLLAVWAALHLCLETIEAYEARLLEQARQAEDLERIKELAGQMVILCAWTKRVKDGERWVPVEEFLERHFQVRISHGMSDEIRQNLVRSATGQDPSSGPDDPSA
jgi:hypothetical protein